VQRLKGHTGKTFGTPLNSKLIFRCGALCRMSSYGEYHRIWISRQ
jgi:hypothetical protein